MSIPGIVVQARMGSSRLPGKVLADLAGAPALSRLFERLKRVRNVSTIVLATSDLTGDDVIAHFRRFIAGHRALARPRKGCIEAVCGCGQALRLGPYYTHHRGLPPGRAGRD